LETIADISGIFGGLFGSALASALNGIDMDLEKRYCCPPDDAKKWQNCKWYGQPGTCFDNHCPIGHSVQLTDSPYGLGESCFPRVERTRVFCCDPSGGKSPFLPVPLENLFPKPPSGSNVDTDFKLEVDDTWGSGKAKVSDNEPDDAAFSFVVLASPEELQVSLDKRDGSHWELFNCNDAVSEEEQTVQMICTDTSESSNCYKLGLGHGVPGTILQMPPGCGPGKYAVAKSMAPSNNQDIPPHLHKRGRKPVVYDLTFD
jgi:chitinase